MKLTKKALLISLTTSLLAACSGGNTNSSETASNNDASAAENSTKKIAITAIVEHPALDSVRQGLEEELKSNGYENGKNIQITFQSAQGNTATAGQIAKKFVGDKPDVIVAIGTPSAQPIVASTKSIPIVFAAVTDPVAAKLVPSWEPSKTNVTGVSDMLPLEPQVQLMKKLVPNLKNLGFVYSPGEINSTVIIQELEGILPQYGIQLISVPAPRTSDIAAAARSITGKVDAIYSSTDNNVISAYESLYKVGVESKTPLIASDPDSAKRGAVAVLGANYNQMGHQVGQMVIEIINGTPAGDLAPQKMDKLDLILNKKSAALMGVTISPELEKEATTIIE